MHQYIGGKGVSIIVTSIRKEMFYLTTHSTHFYLRLYGVRHMVKDHSDSERGNPLSLHELLFPISSNGSFICTIDRITHTTAFVTPVVNHWLEQEIAQWVDIYKCNLKSANVWLFWTENVVTIIDLLMSMIFSD